MQQLRYFGPVRALIDNESATLQLQRVGSIRYQLFDREILNVIDWAVSTLEGEGYTVDTAGVGAFIDDPGMS